MSSDSDFEGFPDGEVQEYAKIVFSQKNQTMASFNGFLYNVSKKVKWNEI